jgi:hypothetical protein
MGELPVKEEPRIGPAARRAFTMAVDRVDGIIRHHMSGLRASEKPLDK